MSKLHPRQRTMLVDLVRAGHGILDTSGRVCIGPLKEPIPGDAAAWLVLVTHGYVAGERGLILPTEAARDLAGAHVDGTVRESRGA